MSSIKQSISIKDCNFWHPIFRKSVSGVEFVQLDISYTMTKQAYDLLNEYGYDFCSNAKEEAKECYFELQRCMFDANVEDMLELP